MDVENVNPLTPQNDVSRQKAAPKHSGTDEMPGIPDSPTTQVSTTGSVAKGLTHVDTASSEPEAAVDTEPEAVVEAEEEHGIPAGIELSGRVDDPKAEPVPAEPVRSSLLLDDPKASLNEHKIHAKMFLKAKLHDMALGKLSKSALVQTVLGQMKTVSTTCFPVDVLMPCILEAIEEVLDEHADVWSSAISERDALKIEIINMHALEVLQCAAQELADKKVQVADMAEKIADLEKEKEKKEADEKYNKEVMANVAAMLGGLRK